MTTAAMYSARNSPTSPSKRVRTLWAEFEGWAHVQEKILERRREDISTDQDLKWKAVPAKTRNKPVEHDAQKATLLQEARDDHFSKLREEWQTKLQKHNLQDRDWGEITVLEQQIIERVLGGDSGEEPLAPVIQNVVTQPQHLSVPMFNPAPPLSSAARAYNLSASTTSSYTLVSVNEFSTDDECEPPSSYIVPTDESEDEHISIPVPIVHSGGWGMRRGWNAHGQASNHSSQTGSPDHFLSSSSSAHDYFSRPPALPLPEINSAPPKRPPDLDRKSGKTRVRGPSYVGPRLSSPEESSEEEDFEVFKMQTRVDKIWEFHLAAARADVELAMAIQNDRVTKKSSGKADDAAKVAAHEKQMLKLQAEKEEERKEIVAAERKKRRDEIRKRSVLGDPARAANTATTNAVQQDWESTFKRGQSVRLDVEKKVFVIGKDDASEPDENRALDTPRFETASDFRMPAPPGPLDTLRARKQSLGRGATPSGWKMKQTPTASLSQWQADPPAAPSPDPRAIPSWMAETFRDTSLDYSSSLDSDDLQLPGGFPTALTSTPVPPIPSGWGPGKSASAAASLLKKVLADPTSMPLPTLSKNKNTPSPPTEVPSKAAPVIEPKPAPAPPAPTSALKKQTKKGRQVIQKKGGSSKAEEDTAASSTTPIAAKPPSSVVSPKDILQQRLVQADDELSSTPRPSFSMKRNPGLMADHLSDAASTPRANLRRLGEIPGTSPSVFASSSRIRETEQEETQWGMGVRLNKIPAPQLASEVRSGWGRPKNMAEEREDEQEEEEEGEISLWQLQALKAQGHVPPSKPAGKEPEETPWSRTQRMMSQGHVPPPKPADVPEETPWQRMQRLNGQGPILPSKPMDKEPEETPWERMQRLKAQLEAPPSKLAQGMREESVFGMQTAQGAHPSQERQMGLKTYSAFAQRGAPSAAPQEEESIWNSVMKGRSQIGDQASGSNSMPQQHAEPEETPWARGMRLQGQKAMSDAAGASSSKSTIDPSVSAWGGSMDYDPPISKLVHQQAPAPTQPASLYWTPNGSVNQTQVWDAHPSDADSSRFYDSAPAGIMKGAKAKKSALKKVTIEEVPDEEGPSGRKRPDERLPSNSRILLDIVEPKPSVPSTMFTNIFHYGEEEEEEEDYDTGLSSTLPTPSTAPTSPPGEIPSLDDEEWLMAAVETAKNGDWDSLVKSSGSLRTDASSKAKQTLGWPPQTSAKKSPSSFEMVDSAKLYSALESVEPATASPPKAVPAPPAPAPAATKTAPMVPAHTPATVEKSEPATKTGNQNQTKGKGKGKGKGRK